MDFIQDAIDKKFHLTGNIERDSQTWAQFQRESQHRKVFLFGLGTGGSYFMYHYHGKVRVDGVIDNDRQKQGCLVGDFVAESFHTEYENLLISDISILEQYSDDEVAVLITSTKYYGQMMRQLQRYGINRCFILLIMEANKRKEADIGEVCGEIYNEEKEKRRFITECCKLPVARRKIIVSIGKYGGHGKCITKQLLKENKKLDIVWVVKELDVEHPAQVRLLYERNWKRYIYEMETAYIWIYDILVPDYIVKRPDQIYIQAKHWSSITLKKFFLDDPSTTDTDSAIEQVKKNGRMMDYLFTGSKFDEETCRRGFAFQGKLVQVGSARTDTLFWPESRKKVFERYCLEEKMHCVLYAPTFRFLKKEKKKFFNLQLDFEKLKKALDRRFDGSWYILLRLHPSLTEGCVNLMKAEYVIDVSSYGDSQELVAASDILISDYSSIMFEPAFVERPVFLFAPDRQEYVEKERDLLIDYDTLPFPIAETNEELTAHIAHFDYDEYKQTLQLFMQKYGVCEDGHASERAAAFILKCMEPYGCK